MSKIDRTNAFSGLKFYRESLKTVFPQTEIVTLSAVGGSRAAASKGTMSFVIPSVYLPQALSGLISALSGLKSALSGLKCALSDSKSERADFRLERADYRPERAWGADG